MSYSVIIPSRNIANLTACVRQIRAMGETCRVIVVWDGDSCENLREVIFGPDSIADDTLRILIGQKPFVFSRACNDGIRETGTDDVVLMNDDALLRKPRGFELLQRTLRAHLDYGAVCPSFTHGSVGTINLVQRRGWPNEIREERTMLVFACVYIPRSTIDYVGLLDERFGINAGGPGARGYGLEDDDYSLRIRQAGLKLGVYDGVLVDHLPESTGLKSTFRHDPEHPHDVRAHEDLFTKIHGHWPEGHGFAPGKSRLPK
jgi:GT2 family glycosyltransferase